MPLPQPPFQIVLWALPLALAMTGCGGSRGRYDEWLYRRQNDVLAGGPVCNVNLDTGPDEAVTDYPWDFVATFDVAHGSMRLAELPGGDADPARYYTEFAFAPGAPVGHRPVEAVLMRDESGWDVAQGKPLGWLEGCGMLAPAVHSPYDLNPGFGNYVCATEKRIPRHPPEVDNKFLLVVRDLNGFLSHHGTLTPIETLLAKWEAAEKAGDVATLDADREHILSVMPAFSPVVARLWERDRVAQLATAAAKAEPTAERPQEAQAEQATVRALQSEAQQAADQARGAEAQRVRNTQLAQERAALRGHLEPEMAAALSAIGEDETWQPELVAKARVGALTDWQPLFFTARMDLGAAQGRATAVPAVLERRFSAIQALLLKAVRVKRSEAEARRLRLTALTYGIAEAYFSRPPKESDGEVSAALQPQAVQVAALAEELLPLSSKLEYHRLLAEPTVGGGMSYFVQDAWPRALLERAETTPPGPGLALLQTSYAVDELTPGEPHREVRYRDDSYTVQEDTSTAGLDSSATVTRLDAQLEDIDRRAAIQFERTGEQTGDRQSPTWVDDPDHPGWVVQRPGEQTASTEWRVLDANYELRKLRDERLAVMKQLAELSQRSAPTHSQHTRTVQASREYEIEVRSWAAHRIESYTIDDPTAGHAEERLVVDTIVNDERDLGSERAWKTQEQVAGWHASGMYKERTAVVSSVIAKAMEARVQPLIAQTTDVREAQLLRLYFIPHPKVYFWDILLEGL